jgi:hypothetical protein
VVRSQSPPCRYLDLERDRRHPLPSGMGKDRRSPAGRGPCSAEIGRSLNIIWVSSYIVGMRSSNNVTFDCTYPVVWCPNYRRDVLVNGADVRLKQIVCEVARERGAKVMGTGGYAGPCASTGRCRPAVRHSPIGQADQGQVLARVASRVPAVPLAPSVPLDQLLEAADGLEEAALRLIAISALSATLGSDATGPLGDTTNVALNIAASCSLWTRPLRHPKGYGTNTAITGEATAMDARPRGG